MQSFKVKNGMFQRDGENFQIYSGSMQYFRIHPGYWRDRLLKLRQCGLNTVETYICWFLHEEEEGRFIIRPEHDFREFIRIAGELDLCVIVRPGPYICCEVDLGGLPGWLLRHRNIRMRSNCPVYMKYVKRYLEWVLAELKELQCSAGGPVVAMQIENEYGYFGNDREYLNALHRIFLNAGIDCILFTSDGPGTMELDRGSIPGLLVSGNAKDCTAYQIANMRKYQPEGPDIFMEVHQGAISCWGMESQKNSPKRTARIVQKLIRRKTSFNLYTFHGGTSFGFSAGGCFREKYFRPFTTSYELDSALDETGKATEKYFCYQKVIGRSEERPADPEYKAYGRVRMTEAVPLLEVLKKMSPHEEHVPRTMEEYGQNFGFINYRFSVREPGCYSLTLTDLQDRAQILVDGVCAGVLYRNDIRFRPNLPDTLPITGERGNFQVDIFVENMGRRIFGASLNSERKGISGILLDGGFCFDLEVFPFFPQFPALKGLSYTRDAAIPTGQPAFYRGTFDIRGTPEDTFVHVPGGRGICWINGFNAGRYWNIGPQHTLYIPAPVLRKGENEVVVFELHGLPSRSVVFQDFHELGPAVSEQFYDPDR